MKIFLGDKFYRFLDDTHVENIRITKIKNENTFIATVYPNELQTYKIKLTKKQIEDYYTRIIPDGTLSFCIANLDLGLKDVIVVLYKTDELKEGSKLPFCACRQSVTDLFIQPTNNTTSIYAGMSVNRNSIPEGLKMEDILACNEIDESKSISVYMDDELDFWLSLINSSRMDTILLSMSTSVKPNVLGYCKTVEQLLKENDFMYDFLSAFDIHTVNFKVQTINEFELIPEHVYALEERFKVQMFKTYVIPYDRTIDMTEIQRNHILIKDIDNKIYIIAYDKGEYINRTYMNNIKDQRELIAMVNNKKITK